MKIDTTVKFSTVLTALGGLLIVALGYNTWKLNEKVQQLQAQLNGDMHSSANVNPPATSLPPNWDPWADSWDPSGHFSDLQKRMDDMMNRMSPGHSIFNQQGFGLSMSSPKITMEESTEEYAISVKVPEGQEIELNTELADNTLRISGKVKNQQQNSFGQQFGSSLSTSQFSQSMTFADPVRESGLTVDQQDDEIVIRIPKDNS